MVQDSGHNCEDDQELCSPIEPETAIFKTGDETKFHKFLLIQSGRGMELYSKWDKELEDRAHVQESLQNT